MVQTVTLSEMDINAIGAALDERSARLSRELKRLRTQPESMNRDYAIGCNEDAVRDTIRARLRILAAVEEPEYPDDMTVDRLRAEADTSAIWHEVLDR